MNDGFERMWKKAAMVLFLCIIPSLAWSDGEKPRSLCQGGQCRGLVAGRLHFVICCQPWLPYTTNVKSTSAVVFHQPVCFYLPLCVHLPDVCSYTNGSLSLLLSHIVCFISSLDRTITTESDWRTCLISSHSLVFYSNPHISEINRSMKVPFTLHLNHYFFRSHETEHARFIPFVQRIVFKYNPPCRLGL